MSDYSFTTVWQIAAPLERVWVVVEDADTWPEWWRGVISVELLEPGDENGVGSVRRTVWKSALPYKLRFDSEVLRVETHKLIEVRAFGELDGHGLWQFGRLSDTETSVRYDWTVKTTKPWMNVLTPIARPFFSWNHDVIMGWGEAGLVKRLAR